MSSVPKAFLASDIVRSAETAPANGVTRAAKTKTRAVFASEFDPPSSRDRRIVEALLAEFDEVLVLPLADEAKDPGRDSLESIHRAAMVDMSFVGLNRVSVDLSALESGARTDSPTRWRLSGDSETWLVVPPEELAKSQSQSNGPFVVLDGTDQPKIDGAPPDRHRRLRVPAGEDAAEIRRRVYASQPFADQVTPEVATYISRHGLYRGTPPQRRSTLRLDSPRYKVVFDEHNERAQEISATMRSTEEEHPSLIVVIGGDGTMLRAIRQYWRLRVPFFGVNAGHVGFLLNERSPLELAGDALISEQLPLLYVEAESPQGITRQELAFNDCWVERASGQAAWIQVKVDDHERLSRLVADGALVSTAAGSSAYARAMGALPTPLNTPTLILVGSNVLRPASWQPVMLPLHSRVELRTLDPVKRPLVGYIDGVSQGPVLAMRARVSKIAAVELAFAADHHPEMKLARIQFPPL